MPYSTGAERGYEVRMPKLGEVVTEGTVAVWLRRVGDVVAVDDPLCEVSTDKVDSEVLSPYDGVVVEILVLTGETVPVGTPVARIAPMALNRADRPDGADRPAADGQ